MTITGNMTQGQLNTEIQLLFSFVRKAIPLVVIADNLRCFMVSFEGGVELKLNYLRERSQSRRFAKWLEALQILDFLHFGLTRYRQSLQLPDQHDLHAALQPAL